MPVAGCGGAEEGKNLDQESALARVSAVRMPPTLESPPVSRCRTSVATGNAGDPAADVAAAGRGRRASMEFGCR
jgi:hypothetical protein